MKRGKGTALRLLSRISLLIYHVIAVSLIGKLFTSYTALCEALMGTAHRAGKKTERARVARRYTVRRALACAMEQNIFSFVRRKVTLVLTHCSLRTLGFFFTVLGGLWVSLYGASLFVALGHALNWIHLISGVISLVVGVLLLFSDRSVGAALRRGSVLGALLFGVLNVHDELIREAGEKGEQHYIFATVLAIFAAALGLLIAPLSMLAILGTAFVVLVILSVPEAGLLLALISLPFSKLLVGSDLLTLAALAVMLLGYFGKLLRGNRAFRIELQDIPVLLMILMFFVSARTSATGNVWQGVLVAVLLALSYLVVVNMLATPHWLFVARVSLAISAVIASLVGIAQLSFAMLHTPDTAFLDFPAFGSAVTAGFTDHVAFAYYLVLAFAFVVPAIPFTAKRYRGLPVMAAMLIALTVFLTFASAAWLALALVLIVFLLVYECRSFVFVFLGSGAVTGTLFLLPAAARSNILGVFRDITDPAALAARAAGGKTVSRIFFCDGAGIFSRANGILRFFFGAGYKGLYTLHPYFAEASLAFHYGSYNFWQLLLVDYGLVGLLVVALFFFLLLQNCFSVLAMAKGNGKPLFAYVGIALTAALLLLGSFYYVWYDFAALGIFFLTAAIAAAAMRYERHRRAKIVEPEAHGMPAAEMDYVSRASRAGKT